MNFAKTEQGQFIFQIMTALGITPQQWRELDPRDSVYLWTAFSEQNRRERAAHDKARQKMKTRR